MERPVYSIIIPCLNEERYIAGILADLSNQKGNAFEVIVVDGCSDDHTASVVQGYKNKFPLRFFKVGRRNVGYQRNFGARKARGAILVFLDADARIRKTFLTKLEQFVGRRKGLVFVPAIAPDIRTSQTQVVFELVNFVVDVSQGLGKPFSSGGSMVFERNFFLLIGGFSEDTYMSEDHEIIQRALKFGVHARFMPNIKVTMSLRRMKKEGSLKLYYQYFLAAVQYLVRGRRNEQNRLYEMGGHLYRRQRVGKSAGVDITASFTQVKDFFRSFFG